MADAKVGSATLGGPKNGQAQRRFSRAAVKIEAGYEHGSPANTAPGIIHNLGGGGLRLASSEDLPREEVLTVKFRIPGGEHDITIRGKVVMSFYDAGHSSYLHGIAFTQIVRADQTAIVEYVESIEHEKSDRS